MQEGLYKVKFHTVHGTGTGVIRAAIARRRLQGGADAHRRLNKLPLGATKSFDDEALRHGSMPRFGRLNHAQADAFNGKPGQPAVPRLPSNRTYPGHHKTDANDPKADLACTPTGSSTDGDRAAFHDPTG